MQRLLFCIEPFETLAAASWGWRLTGLSISFLLLVGVSFALLSLADRINASGMVITRFMARSQAPLTAHFYPPAARNQITVLMYDPAFLDSSRSNWPIPYGDHADWLLRISSNPNARPRAIMVDVTFGQERDDPTLPQLQEALCTIQNDYGVPVFLAALASVNDGALYVRKGLSPTHPTDGRTCFTLVDVGYEADPLDRLVWNYPMTRHLGPNGWLDGAAANDTTPTLRSAAMRIAQDAAGLNLGVTTPPMALVWGLRTPDLSMRPALLNYCREGITQWSRLVPGVVRDVFSNEPSGSICPYHTTLSMSQVASLEEDVLRPLLANRFVMVGAFVPGYNDLINAPIHGLIPGIYMHAMALDNLLTYGDHYKLSTDWADLWTTPELIKAALAAVAAIYVVHLAWSLARRRLLAWQTFMDWRTSIPGLAWYERKHSLSRRTLKLLLDMLAWLLKRMAQTAAALLLVAYLQSEFRIGMLPVVELVTMTLVAEGLDAMARIRRFISGEDDKPASTPASPDITQEQAKKESA
ncbi:CHASE2 domain-containing protein [Thauera aromatica]|nr:CHASE2 domain-containing protein [Thauera aromatica]